MTFVEGDRGAENEDFVHAEVTQRAPFPVMSGLIRISLRDIDFDLILFVKPGLDCIHFSSESIFSS